MMLCGVYVGASGAKSHRCGAGRQIEYKRTDLMGKIQGSSGVYLFFLYSFVHITCSSPFNLLCNVIFHQPLSHTRGWCNFRSKPHRNGAGRQIEVTNRVSVAI